MKNFKEANLPPLLLKQLEKINFSTPTPIQMKTIPEALKGSDIMGSAQTGTGKTGAFGIPLIAKILSQKINQALILLPTRELATQVLEAMKSFVPYNINIKTALLIGGAPMGKQLNALQGKPQIIVGTPGRVNDHLKRKTLSVARMDFLVLDEVDRMLDMGFEVQLNQIATYFKAPRQTLMFSATLPKSIEKIAAKYLTNPIRISVGSSRVATPQVKQEHIKISVNEKYPTLLKEITDREGSVLVFVKTKHGADRIAKSLKKDGHKSDALHGDLRQNVRTRVIDSFRQEKYRILVATDVAARGLDIPHIQHVINYDLPQCPEDYIHRIGRTGRAGATGSALNFISPADGKNWKAIQRLMNINVEEKEERPRTDRDRNHATARNNRMKSNFDGEKTESRSTKIRSFFKKPNLFGKKPSEKTSEKSSAPRENRNPKSNSNNRHLQRKRK
ncbi:MAG: DEAD/DEAH box helicase [Alphaproteobacteria bacterium]|nr:DEAD/DEAH box helicase [Alphaproteobacteria bacterium]